jgi:hypothetical protein
MLPAASGALNADGFTTATGASWSANAVAKASPGQRSPIEVFSRVRRQIRHVSAGFALRDGTTDTLGTMTNPDPSTLWVISVPAVRTSIEILGKQKIHSTFMMYLYLRMKAGEGKLAEASPSSDEMRSIIQMPGNPEKPYYVPMLDRGARDAGLLPGFWRARNIAGLWGAATLGRSDPLSWLTDGAGKFAMPANNADLALNNLLYGNRILAAAMAAFLLRDQVFLKDDEPTSDDLIDTFRVRFGFPPASEADFVKLFDVTAPALPEAEPWFELAPAEVLKVLIG